MEKANIAVCLFNRDLQIRVRVRLFKPSAYAFDYRISHQSRTDSLFFNWSGTGRSEGSENVIGSKFESRSRSDVLVLRSAFN